LRQLLNNAWIYTLTQWFWYRSGQQQRYVQEWIRPRPGDRILDIGCGPGALLARFPEVDYVGYDPNSRYIADATARFGRRGHFHCGTLTDIPDADAGSFDIVLANGVLHHISDEAAHTLLLLARKALKPKGRMITRDGCYVEGQPWLTRFLLRSDRGGFVRDQPAYEALFRPHLNVVRTTILQDALRLPYSLILFELTPK
jgi:SAM-dependent methyltransferase